LATTTKLKIYDIEEYKPVWCTEMLICPHCNMKAVHVFHESSEKLECDCGSWFYSKVKTLDGKQKAVKND